MNKTKAIASIFAVLAVVMIGVFFIMGYDAKGDEVASEENTVHVIDTSENSDIIDGQTDSEQESVDEEEDEVVLDENMAYAPLTGLPVKKETVTNRPIAIMYDNYFKARPQAGLGEAEVVYEMLAEGLITRYLGVFQVNQPETVGPIRSARPYFITKALEYDPYYVHVGGSMQALTDISNLKMADVDGLSSGSNVFWRKKHKPIPNNMYSSTEAIQREANRRGYRTETEFEFLEFNEKTTAIDGEDCDYIKVRYKQPTGSDSVGYYVEFKYNEDTGLYERYVNGKPHIDEADDEQLAVSNILVQYAPHKVIDNEGRLDVDLVGEGKGYYLTAGEKIDVTWKKDSRSDLTRFYDAKGHEVKLNPGVSWFQVVPMDIEIGW